MAFDPSIVEDEFLEAAAQISGLVFREPQDDPEAVNQGYPGVTMEFEGEEYEYDEFPRGVTAQVTAEWTIRLYVAYETRALARAELLTYLPPLHEITAVCPEGIELWELSIGDKPEYDSTQGKRKVVKRLTLTASLYAVI